ncbi:FHA domain-containing protein [Corallococcus sp. AB049A]|uniref:FHA domain-containing protein n=1 Tax=Corallococcus interemptor TaxID=2316720 RepID=A0A3A8R957_9BACT|nr:MULTISPECIES: FHA domain-containing protein [Corallococcus]RKH71894.1 FHA domain-containing protein [Corallococcus interemptor]RKI58901.1 FHA domain-containing protein [Corallococcus sp. AB049A]
MDEVIFLEVLEGDAVQSRHRLDKLPVSVGRGYANDIILDDPKVSAEHLRLERREDGAVVLHDVGSVNGTFSVEPWARLKELVLTPDTRVSVGDTVLRFRPRSFMVEDTVVNEAPASPRERLFERPRAFALAMQALVAVSFISERVTQFGKTDWGDLLLSSVLPLGLALLWAGGWSLASRIARRSFHFRVHATIGALLLLGFAVAPPLFALLSFSFSLGAWLGFVRTLAVLGLVGWGLYWHLRYVTRWRSARLVRGLVIASLGVLTLTNVSELLGNEPFSESLEFPRSLLPPVLRVAPARSMDSFFEDVQPLEKKVDALVKER